MPAPDAAPSRLKKLWLVRLTIVGRSARATKLIDSSEGTRQAIADANIQPGGISLLAVGADIGERHARLGAVLDLGDLPQLAVKAVRPAMKRMLAVIGRQLHRIAIENEARVRDTVGVAADGRAEEAPIARDSL